MSNFKYSSGVLVGNSLQFYDFTIYAFLTPQISKYFFTTQNVFLSYLITFGVFAGGYFTRPLGALIFGHIGDSIGRSKALSKSIIISIFATFTIGVLPSPSMIGLLSPISLVMLRLIQGIAVGGEEGGAVVLLFEKNNFKNKGVVSTLVLSSVLVGVLIGSIISFISTKLIINVGDWAWRIPFLFSLPLGIIAIKLRYILNDFVLFKGAQENRLTFKTPTKILLKDYLPEIVFGICIAGVYSITTSTLIVNLPYLLQKMGFKQEDSLGLIAISNILVVLLSTVFGYFCDKYKPLTVYYVASLLIIIFFPISFKFFSIGTTLTLLISILIISILIAFLSSAIFSILVEIFPFGVRYSGVSFAFNLSITIFSSTTPLVLIILENSLKDLTFSALYISATCALMMLISIFIYKNDWLSTFNKEQIYGLTKLEDYHEL